MPKRREWSEEERGKVVGLRAAGKSYREIFQLTKVPETTAQAIVAKASRTGSVVNQPRSGRPTIFTPTVQKHIHSFIQRQSDINAKELANKLTQKFGRTFARAESSVRKTRVRMGYTKAKGIGLDTHKKQRIVYYNKHKKDRFINVIFSDEKPWVIGKRRRPLWRKSVRSVYWKTKPTKIQCWGSISFRGKTRLRIWTGRKPSDHYIETIDGYLLPFAKS
jgi:transposase